MHKRTQARINTAIMFVLLITLTILVAWLSHRYSAEWDWTSAGRHSLSQSSKDVLDKMDGEISIVSYASNNPGLRDAIQQFVQKYKRHKKDINFSFINPQVVPEEVRAKGITTDGELLITYKDKTLSVKDDSEQNFTNVLLQLARDKEHWLAFIEGHGERKGLGQANFDLGLLGSQLSQRGFRIQPLNLSETSQVPENASVLVIAGPKVDYLPGEIELLKQAINNGQNILWLVDPGEQYGLEAIAELLDIEIPQGTIIDYAGQLVGINDVSIVLATQSSYLPHNITENFSLTTLFPGSAEIITKKSDTWAHTPFIETGAHTWNEKDEINEELSYDETKDKIGPLTLALAIERTIDADFKANKKQRILVIGDGDFLSNTYLENSGNIELGMRMFNWLAEDDEFITIAPKTAEDTQLTISNITLGIMGLVLVFALPALLIVIGITISIRRRRA